jgi:ABC-type branched-subunit amino acid transport system substrate-binding protein
MRSVAMAIVLSGLLTTSSLAAEKRYDAGASDTEIRIGQTMPYSGAASGYGVNGKAELAYWKMVNSQGGINGRKVTLLSMDDGYSPAKTVEQTRRLVEQDEVLAIIGSLGTPTNSAVQKYLSGKKVPHIFITSGASKWNNPANFPTTTPFYPPYEQEARIYGKYIAREMPDAKVAVIYQNDDFGKDYLKGFKNGLGAKSSLIVIEASYEVGEPTIDSQIVNLKASGADTLLTIATPKFAAQSIRKVASLGWKPAHFMVSVGSSVGGVLEPAGFEASTGLITALTAKVVGDPAWDDDKGVKDYLAFMKAWYPDGNPIDGSTQIGYGTAQMTEILLRACGDDLTRENLVRQATHLTKVSLPLFLPGVTISTTPTDYAAYNTFKMARFDGKTWKFFGDNIDTSVK